MSTRRQPLSTLQSVADNLHYVKLGSFEGDYWSATLGCLVHHESGLEKRFAVEADFRRDVVAYSWQPLIFAWPRGTPGRRDHVPDFFCRLDSGDGLVVDVKSADHTEAAADQFALTRTACETVGWQYEVFSGWEPQRAFNMEHLCTYRRTRFVPAPSVRDAALTAFAVSVRARRVSASSSASPGSEPQRPAAMPHQPG